jgi:hypothetical protein
LLAAYLIEPKMHLARHLGVSHQLDADPINAGNDNGFNNALLK